MKKIKIFVLVCIILISLGYIMTHQLNKKESQKSTKFNSESSAKKQICPDEWFDNQMPQVVLDDSKDRPPTQYFVVDGVRQEIENYDLNWIKQNCDIKPQVVQ